MKTRATIVFALGLAASTLFAAPAFAASASASAASELTQGEVRKIDKDTGKITIKHEPIKSLDMPGMTMVFQVKDKTMLDKVQANDKIKFKASQENGKMMVTEIESGK